MEKKWNEGKTFLVVTGASKGLGKAFATALSSNLSEGSTVYLTARTEEALIETQNNISAINGKIDVKYFIIDQENAEKVSYVNMFKNIKSDNYEFAIIVHNAGSIGKQGQMVRDYDDKDELINYYKLNLFSVAILNSVFMKTFSQVRKIVINISSLAALQPFVTWGNYCAGKAARDALFGVLALEENESEDSSIIGCKVLNYAPGPVHTAMIDNVIQDQNVHQGVKESFCSMIANKTILKPEQSAEKLVQILDEDNFKSGDHIDYYD